MSYRRLFAPALVLVLAACGGSSDDPDAADTAVEISAQDTTGTGPDDGDTAVEAEGSGGQSSTRTPAWPLGSRIVELGVQASHQSGVVVTLERLVVEPTFVVLELTAANGSPEKVALAADAGGGIELTTDDVSTVLSYRAPSTNDTLELSSGEVLEGEIVFLGILGPEASSMDVTFNPQPDEGSPEPAQPTIGFVDLPLDLSGS